MTDDTREQWRVVPQYPIYEASNLGRVRSKERSFYCLYHGRLFLRHRKARLMSYNVHDGYERVTITGPDKRCTCAQVHRLVAFAWIPNTENKPYINHKDSNTRNNNIENLEWCTPAENLEHCTKNGRRDHVRITRQCTEAAAIARRIPLDIADLWTGCNYHVSSADEFSEISGIPRDAIHNSKRRSHLLSGRYFVIEQKLEALKTEKQ